MASRCAQIEETLKRHTDLAGEPLDARVLELLVCPLTKSPLRYDRDAQELISDQAKLAYPIRDGIPIMLVSEARQLRDGA